MPTKAALDVSQPVIGAVLALRAGLIGDQHRIAKFDIGGRTVGIVVGTDTVWVIVRRAGRGEIGEGDDIVLDLAEPDNGTAVFDRALAISAGSTFNEVEKPLCHLGESFAAVFESILSSLIAASVGQPHLAYLRHPVNAGKPKPFLFHGPTSCSSSRP